MTRAIDRPVPGTGPSTNIYAATRRRRHVTAAHLARRTGLTARWLAGRACAGKIPGAVHP